MTAAAWLYRGEVMHARMKPFTHRFTYRVWSLLIDIDRIDEAVAAAPLMRRNRFGLAAFHDADHGPRDGSAIRPWLDALLAQAGRTAPACVRLLCYPRVLGYAFNPIAVYYCYDAAGAISDLVYEVRNTFGERHVYLCPVEPGQASSAGVRQSREKQLFVSPFLGFGLTYRFRLDDPGERLRLRILETDATGPVLAATFSGRRHALTNTALLRACAAVPLLGIKVMACIHWEALRVWVKGARLFPRPAPPPAASLGDPPLFINEANRQATTPRA